MRILAVAFKLSPVLALVAVSAWYLHPLGGPSDANAAATFNPTFAASVTSTAAVTQSKVTTTFSLHDGDVNFAAIVSFIPPQWGVVKGDSIPVNTTVGTVSASIVLGLINGACNTPINSVTFDIKNGSLNTNDTVPFNDSNDTGTIQDFADDQNQNTVKDGVEKYPDWLNRIFSNKQPIRRFVGITPVAGIPVILQSLVFPPGTQIDASIPSDPNLGFPFVTVLQNLGDPSPAPADPSVFSDFCTPLQVSNQMLGETPAHAQLFVNPTDGKYTFTVFALGQRDKDGDSYENALDTCPLTPNVGSPRIATDGDTDSDGLDAACDPAPGSSKIDQDGDGYLNRQDNCPLVANGVAQAAGAGNQTDADLDQIGDACDPSPNTPDGAMPSAQRQVDVTIGAGGSGPGSAPSEAQCPNCWRGAAVSPTSSPTATATTTATATATQTATATPTHTPTPTPVGQTPSPTPTFTPTSTPTATAASPTPTTSPTTVPTVPPVVYQGGVRCGRPSVADVMDMLVFSSRLGTGVIPGCLTIAAQQINGYKWGDVNCDGNVDALDALYVLAYLAGIDLSPLGQNCIPIGGLMGSSGQHVETALEAALRIAAGILEDGCPSPKTVVHPFETNVTSEPRGLANFGVSGCDEPGAVLTLGRTVSGEWKTYFVAQQGLRPAVMPSSEVVVCDQQVVVYGQPDSGSAVVANLEIGVSLSAQEFILDQPGPPMGRGWYRISSPVAGWVDSEWLRPSFCF